MKRRHLLASVAAGLAIAPARTQPSTPTLIDTNVSLGRWPFRRLPLDETAALVAKLRSKGVVQAWAGSFDALLHKDITAVNERLTAECRSAGDGLLLPVGALNPTLPTWELDLRNCAEVHGMPGIRLHPNYHGYVLSDPVCEAIIERSTQLGLFVQIALIMEEERTIHPLVNVPATDATPLLGLARKFPTARIQILNGFRSLKGQPVVELAAAGIRFEIAMLEGVAGVGHLLGQVPPGTLCFGSHAPFFYFESAQLKLQESPLTPEQLAAVSANNARDFLNQR